MSRPLLFAALCLGAITACGLIAGVETIPDLSPEAGEGADGSGSDGSRPPRDARGGDSTSGNDAPSDVQCSACDAGASCCSGSCVNTASDPENCGACGDPCRSPSVCSGGACQLATGLRPSGIAVNKDYVYWTEWGNGALKRVPIGGGIPSTLFSCPKSGCSATNPSSPQEYAAEVALDDTHAYWTSMYIPASGPGFLGTVARIDLDGGSVTVLASVDAEVQGIAVDAGVVYFTEQEIDGGSVVSVQTTGGTTMTLATEAETPLFIASTAQGLYWTQNDQNAGGMGYAVVHKGSSTVTLASGNLGTVTGIATDEANVYFTFANPGRDGGAIKYTTLGATGTGSPATLATVTGFPWLLAVDHGDVYYTDFRDGGPVTQVGLDDGGKNAIASGQPLPDGVAVDATHVYWTDYVPGGRVMKAPK